MNENLDMKENQCKATDKISFGSFGTYPVSNCSKLKKSSFCQKKNQKTDFACRWNIP